MNEGAASVAGTRVQSKHYPLAGAEALFAGLIAHCCARISTMKLTVQQPGSREIKVKLLAWRGGHIGDARVGRSILCYGQAHLATRRPC